jgi:Domain of unknown function (DUF6268)
MRRIIMVAIVISVANKSVGQSNDTAFSFDYTLAPIANDGIDFSKTDFKMSIPVKLKKGLLVNTIGAEFYKFNYTKDYNFLTTDLSTINDISYGLEYTHSISDTWRLNTQAKASIVSNLTTYISYNDLLFSGEASITKIINEDTQEALTIGLNYSAITGRLRMLPTINYTKRVSDKFSYGIGFPDAFAEYKMTDLSTLKSSLSVDGFYSNLSTPIFVNATDKANKASFSSASLALEYHYKMDAYWGMLLKGGYALSNRYKLIDSENNTIFNFNTKPEPFFSAGIRFNLNTK